MFRLLLSIFIENVHCFAHVLFPEFSLHLVNFFIVLFAFPVEDPLVEDVAMVGF
jgi:hypothetical protein